MKGKSKPRNGCEHVSLHNKENTAVSRPLLPGDFLFQSGLMKQAEQQHQAHRYNTLGRRMQKLGVDEETQNRKRGNQRLHKATQQQWTR